MGLIFATVGITEIPPHSPSRSTVLHKGFSGASSASTQGGFSSLTSTDILSKCHLEVRKGQFYEQLKRFSFDLPSKIGPVRATISSVMVGIQDALKNSSLKLEADRRLLINYFVMGCLKVDEEKTKDLRIFCEANCVSSLFLKKGPIDYVFGTCGISRAEISMKLILIEAKACIDDVDEHLPQFVGELDATMNGGEYSQGVLTDGKRWWFAVMEKKRNPPGKPTLCLFLSNCVEVVDANTNVLGDMVEQILLALYCFATDGVVKIREAHLSMQVSSLDVSGGGL